MPKQHDNANDEQAEMDDAAHVDDDMTAEYIELSEDAIELVGRLESERDEAVAARQRALADFRNFQRRSIENEARAEREGTAAIARSLLPVLDHFELALNQELDDLTMEQFAAGVDLVRDELEKALALHGVVAIDPDVGDPFDPNMHEAMMRQSDRDVPPNGIVLVLQTGYRFGDLVLRPAKVAVAPGEDDDDDGGEPFDDEV